jgi:hypothetical protein
MYQPHKQQKLLLTEIFAHKLSICFYFFANRLPHAREEVFQGNFYDNIFLNFQPAWYNGSTVAEILYPFTHKRGKTKFD